MKWKDTNDNGSSENEEESFEEAYSPLKSQKGVLGFNWSSLFGKPVVWYAAGAVILVILIIVVVSGGDSDTRQRDALEKRIVLLEKRLELLDQIGSRLEVLEEDKNGTKPLMVRLERLETSIAQKLTDMSNKINEIQKKIPARSTRQDSKTDIPGKSAGQYHIVQQGETLYSISKQHGLTVEQLTRLNNLRKGSPIQPGQRLSLK
jgi:Tfp pilus assembly protein PilN